jgi:hypothetical protein
MALRDWSARRILGVWTGWMAALLVTLLGAVIANPTGVTLKIAPTDLPLAGRIAIGFIGLVGGCLPPAILTYVWYIKRLRAWGERAPGADELSRLSDEERARLLNEGEAGRLGHKAYERSEIGRPGRHT